ncbi:MAG: hypothetical protein Athens101410_695 [Parcubacteria group bacterium Athens1014_10]|nr:MAG: hypothetical protein Athens101410_695 [Parcubacteria group bacterium Athens1014_10]TSD04680.1 MAG: hypothetical protein Athens071412_675 [Parcubacteria group bacterium Athens0714_12]
MHDLAKKCRKGGKRALTYAVVATTLICTSGFTAILPVVGATIVDGDLVKSASSSAVYLIQGAEKRVFPHYNVYLSQGYPSDFSTVKSVSASDLASYSDGTAVPFRDGSLFRGTSSSLHGKDKTAVFVVSKGKLRPIKSGDIYQAIYNDANWNYVTWVPDDLLSKFNYALGNDVESSTTKVDGSIVKYAGSGTLYLIEDGAKRAFTSWDAYTANRFDKSANVVPTITVTETYPDGANVTGAESVLVTPGAGATVITTAGTLTVALASDTPASGIAVGAAIRVPFTKVNFTAGSSDVTIDSLTMERAGGAARDGAFSSIAVLNAADNVQIGLNKTLNSSHQTVLNDDILVKAGTTKSILLTGNMVALATIAGYAGEIPTLSLVTVVLKDSATLSGALPITGNYQTINGTVTVAAVQIGVGGSNPTSDSVPEVGKTNIDLTEIKIKNNSSTEKVQLEQIKFTQSGGAADGDVTNLKLVDSSTNTTVATLSQFTSKAAVFSFTAPIVIDKGYSKTYMLKGDVESGSSRTVDADIWYQTDVLVKGQTYGYYVSPDFYSDSALATAVSSDPRVNGQAHTIGTGNIKIETSSLAGANIAENTTQQTIGAFNFTVKGEPVEVTSIGWQVLLNTSTTGADYTDITKVTIYDANGKSVAGPMDISRNTYDTDSTNTDDESTATTTDTIVFPVGTHTYTVKADLSADFANNDTIKVRVHPKAITARGQTTGTTFAAAKKTPTNGQTSSTMTIKAAALAVNVGSTPAAQTIVRGKNQFSFATLILNGVDSGDDVKISQIKMDIRTTTGYPAHLSNIQLYDGDTALSTTNNVDDGISSSTANAAATTTFSLTTQLVITKGTTKTLTFKANVGSATTNNSIFSVGLQSGNTVTAKDSGGNDITSTYSYSNGQSMTVVTSGTITISKAGDTPSSALSVAGQSGFTAATLMAQAKYEDIEIEKIWVGVGQVNSKGGGDQLNKVYLYDWNNNKVGEGSATCTDSNSAGRVLVSISTGSLVVPANTTKKLTLKADMAGIGDGAGDTAAAGDGFVLSVNAVEDLTIKGASSGPLTSNATNILGLTSAITFNEFTVFKSVPTVTTNDQLATADRAGGTLTAGTQTYDLYKFKVKANSAGDIGLAQVVFYVSTSTATTTNFQLFESGESSAVSTTTPNDKILIASASITNAVGNSAYVAIDITASPYYRTIGAGVEKTYTLKADVVAPSGTTAGSVTAKLIGDTAWPSAYPKAQATIIPATKNSSDLARFVWSDLNQSVTSTAHTANQWTNGYRVLSGSGTLQTTSSAATWSK